MIAQLEQTCQAETRQGMHGHRAERDEYLVRRSGSRFHPGRSGHVEHAGRRTGTRLFLPPRRQPGHAHGSFSRPNRGPGSANDFRRGPEPGPAGIGRRTARGGHRRRHRQGTAQPGADRAIWPASLPRRRPKRTGSFIRRRAAGTCTRRRAPFRPCAFWSIARSATWRTWSASLRRFCDPAANWRSSAFTAARIAS